ncbi:hypothetical protein EBZ39_04480 [bacterium]|nr:hypothetical protein [bacterium]
MRYFIKLKRGMDRAVPLLTWLLHIDSTPNVLPVFPDDDALCLVVAQLMSGEVFAEVLPHPENITAAVGQGLPLGRLYFQIPKDRVYSVCENLTPEVFRGTR